MKRVIKNTYIGSGISLDGNTIKINISKDIRNDLVKIGDVAGKSAKDDIQYIYLYKYVSNATNSQKAQIRRELKTVPNHLKFDIESLVEYGVVWAFNNYDLDDVKVLIRTRSFSKSSLLDIMETELENMVDCYSTPRNLVKEMYENVLFDESKAYGEMKKSGNYSEDEIQQSISNVKNKFDELKKSGNLFEMKKFLPRPLRSGFSNFLKFESTEEKLLYQKLENGTHVLVFDDFLTSGSTLKEIHRYLNSINPGNRLSSMVLLDQS